MPAVSATVAMKNVREKYLSIIRAALENSGEEIMVLGSQKIGFPTVDELGEDRSVVITVSVPKGSRDGDEFDLYGEAQAFTEKQADKAARAAQRQKEKEEKIRIQQERKAAKAAKEAEKAKEESGE